MKSDIFKRLRSSSSILTLNFPKYVPPLFSIVVFQKVLAIHSAKKSNELLFKIGKGLGKLISHSVKKSLATASTGIIKACLNEMEYMGLGKSEVLVLKPSNKFIIIKNLSNTWAKQYKKTFGRQSKNIDFFISGVYSGIFSILFKNGCYFKEKECIAKGDESCIFSFSSKSIFSTNYFDQSAIDLSLSETNLIFNKKSTRPNVLVQKMFNLDHITLNEGNLRVWSMHCVMLPFDFYQVIFDFFEWSKVNVKDIVLYFGILQSKIAILFQVNKFGIKKGIDTFMSLLQQMELLGLGKGKLIQHSDKVLEVEFKNNFSAIQHKKMFLTKDYYPCYMIGLISGMAIFSFDKMVKSSSISINKNLNIKLTFTKNKNESLLDKLKSKIKDSRIKLIIEEKMKHKYYLN